MQKLICWRYFSSLMPIYCGFCSSCVLKLLYKQPFSKCVDFIPPVYHVEVKNSYFYFLVFRRSKKIKVSHCYRQHICQLISFVKHCQRFYTFVAPIESIIVEPESQCLHLNFRHRKYKTKITKKNDARKVMSVWRIFLVVWRVVVCIHHHKLLG